MQMLATMGITSFQNRTTYGYPITVPRLPDPSSPLASAGQAEFMDKLLAAAKARYAVIGKAGTGNGKTVTGMWVASKLGGTTLIIAPSVAIAYNWKDELMLHLGLEEHEIGWVQSAKKCNFRGKKFVIVVLHSLAQCTYPPAFYRYFRTVIYDEVQDLGAEMFSRCMGRMLARYQIALSATPERKDGCTALFTNYFGADLVEAAEDPPMECIAKMVDYVLPFGPGKFPQNPAIALSILAKLPTRNALIASWVNTLYKKKRIILVLSDRIDQLVHLREFVSETYGIPLWESCIYAAQEIVKGRRVSIPDTELQRRKKRDSIRIYYATYGVFKKGENIPRLNAGVEATPRSDGKQPPGRIRRRLPGKPKPFWVSIRDVGGGWKLNQKTKSRLKEFNEAAITVT
jgi:hypothetical protein